MRPEPSLRLEPELGNEEHLLVLLGADQPDADSNDDPGKIPPGFRLGPSRLSVGAGDRDDVFLSGVGVAPAHLQMVFVDGRITLLSATQEVRLAGTMVEAFPVDWAPLQVLSLSPETHLSYGPAGSVWPKPVAWDRSSASPTDAATGEPLTGAMGEQDLAPGGYESSAPESGAARLEASELEDDGGPERFARAPKSRKQAMSRTVRLVASGLVMSAMLVTGLAVADLTLGQREVVSPSDYAIGRSAKTLSGFLAKEPAQYAGVEISRRDDGAVQLTGFVASEEAYRALAEQVREETVVSDGNVRLDVMTPMRLQALVRDHLARYPLDSRVEVQSDRVRLVVFGVEMDVAVMERLQNELGRLSTRLKPRTLQLEFRVATPDAFFNEVAMALSKSPSTRDMQFTIGDEGGLITGLVAAPVEGEARAALLEVKRSFEGRLPLEIDLKVDPKLNFRVVSLTLGGNQSTATLMQRGKTQTFVVGDPVFGTGELREIKNDGVVVALGRREMFIPLLK